MYTAPEVPRRRRIVTSGFGAVDILRNGVMEASPGGTAVNVAAAMASLGWDAAFAGTIGTDPTGAFLRKSLQSSGVDVTYLRQDERWSTPVVLQERRHNDHVWRFSCPLCGARFAKHRPGPVSAAQAILRAADAPEVFFFDRTSLFTLELAEGWAAAGTLVVFEPAALGRPQLFDRAVAAASLVKFSSERGADFEERVQPSAGVVVRTLGKDGVEYRAARSRSWDSMPAFEVDRIVDTAGAGDWTTAGILQELHTSGASGLDLERAVRAGQVMGARACTWEGVRPEKPLTMPRDEFEAFACPATIARESNLAPTH